MDTLENLASGWALGRHARAAVLSDPAAGVPVLGLAGGVEEITAETVAIAATFNDPLATGVLSRVIDALADAICATIVLICPKRFVIGGGVSLIGDRLLFAPLRQRVAERVFQPFAGLTEIVPAALGEAVVVHGALALARQKLGG